MRSIEVSGAVSRYQWWTANGRVGMRLEDPRMDRLAGGNGVVLAGVIDSVVGRDVVA